MTVAHRIVVAGVGNPYRRDDGVGGAVVDALRRSGLAASLVDRVSEPLDLVESFDSADLVLVVDAARSGARPGTVFELDLSAVADAEVLAPTSTHGIGVARAVQLARVLGRVPSSVVVLAVEGEDFTPGEGLSRAVAAAVPAVVRRIESLAHRADPDPTSVVAREEMPCA